MAEEAGLPALAAEILGAARQEAAELLAAAGEEAAAVLEQARREAATQREAALREARREAEGQRLRALSAAQLAARRQLLARREELITQALGLARERLRSGLTSGERRAALEELVLEAAIALGGGALTVRANARDAELLAPGFWQEVGSRLAAAGVAAEWRQGPPAAIAGGAVVSKDEGRLVFDNSFEARLERQGWALRNEVWQALSRAEAPERERVAERSP